MEVSRGGKFSHTIKSDQLSVGLRRSKRNPRNSGFMTSCQGAVGRDKVLQILDEVSRLATTVITDGFPYPQIFVFPNMIIVCSATTIYEYEGGALVAKHSTVAGDIWTAVAFYDYVYMSNNKVAVVRSAEDKTYSRTDDLPVNLAACNYNGQVVIYAPEVNPEPPIIPAECIQTLITSWSAANNEWSVISNADRLYIASDAGGYEGFGVYSKSGDFIYQVAAPTENPVRGIAVDDNYVYIGRQSGVPARIERFHKTDGAYDTFWKVGGSTYGSSPKGIIRYDNYLYVTSTYGLHKYSLPDGVLIWEVPIRGTGEGEFYCGYAIDMNADYIYVADYSYHKVVKYLASNGTYVMEASLMIPRSPRGLTILGDYIFMSASSSIYVFNLDIELVCIAPGSGNKGSICNDGTFFYGINDTSDLGTLYTFTVDVWE